MRTATGSIVWPRYLKIMGCVDMKLCTKCGIEQPTDNFHKGKRYVGGLRTWCKQCVSTYKRQYRGDNYERLLTQQRQYDAVHNPLRKEYFQQHYIANKAKIDARIAAYRKQNLAQHAAKEAKRRFSKAKRTPAWLDVDDLWMIEQAFELAALRTKIFGFAWEVDHVLPLQGKYVSGLHTPLNLQVIPAQQNRRKTNNFEVVL